MVSAQGTTPEEGRRREEKDRPNGRKERRKGESDVAGDPPRGEARAKGMDVDQVRSSGYTEATDTKLDPEFTGTFPLSLFP